MGDQVLKKIMYALIAAVVVLAGVLAYIWYQKSSLVNELTFEKEELTAQMIALQNDYETLSSEYDDINLQLDSSRIEVQLLIEKLQKTEATNRSKIRQYEKELGTLRSIMRNYVVQIDSLNRVNEKLSKENTRVRNQYKEATRKVETLQEEAKNLSDKVTLAAQLDATGIAIHPRNKRGKETASVKSVVKFAIDFTIVKNITAATGERTIYVRITKPDGTVLTKNSNHTFKYENTQLEYSIKKLIEYTGEEQSVTVYWDVEEFLNSGEYTVYLFSDGVMIGEKSFVLE
mgnify:CR=1 FL=1